MFGLVAKTGGRLMPEALRRWLAAVLIAVLASPAFAAGLAEGGSQRLGTKITVEVEAEGRSYRFVAAILARDDGVTY